MWLCTAQASSNHGLLQVTQSTAQYCSQRAKLMTPVFSQNTTESDIVPLSSISLSLSLSGVTLSEEEADNNQGNRFCLVAIGRLQVLFHFPFYFSFQLISCHILRNHIFLKRRSLACCSCCSLSPLCM